MNWLFTLFFRWLDRRKSDVSFEFGPTVAGRDETVAFTTHLTNDGTKIARRVVVRGLLDGDEVYVADPVDVPWRHLRFVSRSFCRGPSRPTCRKR